MFSQICFLTLIISMEQVICSNPLDDYIVEVSTDCGSLADDKPVLKILSDYSITAKARCVGGDQEFIATSDVDYTLNATFKSGNDRCQFVRRKMYFIEVVVLYGIKGARLVDDSKTYTLICSFDDNGKSISTNKSVIEGSIAPDEIVVLTTGTNVSSTHITLSVQDVLKRDIKGPVTVDSYVSLYATSDGSNGEKGLRVVSCDIINVKDKTRYNILRTGCSHGQVFKNGSGFITQGRTTRSPYFKPVMAENKDIVQFECKFALCSKNCDGNSCENNNRE